MMKSGSNVREKRPRAAKPKSFLCEDDIQDDNPEELPLPPGASQWVYLDEEKMYNFLGSHPDTILSLHKGKINPRLLRKDEETGKLSIIYGSLGYPAGTAIMDRLTFTVSARIGADGACPFGLHETNLIFAGQPATYYAYIAVTNVPIDCIKAEFILELEDLEIDKEIDDRLKRFVIRDMHRNPKQNYDSGEDDEPLWQEDEVDSDTVNHRVMKKVRRKRSRSLEPSMLESYEVRFQAAKEAKLKELTDHLLRITSDEILTNPKYDSLKKVAINLAAQAIAFKACGLSNEVPDPSKKSP